MSEIAPLDAGFDLSICGFGQASGRAGGGDGHLFAPLAGLAIVVAIASTVSVAGAAVSGLAIFGSRIEGPSRARR